MCLEYTEHDDVELKVLEQQGRTTGGVGGGWYTPTFGKLIGKFYGWSVNVMDCR